MTSQPMDCRATAWLAKTMPPDCCASPPDTTMSRDNVPPL
jgi:hypothetical protein